MTTVRETKMCCYIFGIFSKNNLIQASILFKLQYFKAYNTMKNISA